MRLRSHFRWIRRTLWIGALASLPSWAAASPTGADVTQLLVTVWAPATAYGLAMLSMYSKGQK